MRKYAPKNVKVCPGCPPVEVPVIKFPNLMMSVPESAKKEHRVVTVDLGKYNKPRINGRQQTSLF